MYANIIIAAVFVGVTVGAYFTGANNQEKIVRGEFAALRLQEQTEHQAAINAAWKVKTDAESKWQAAFSGAGKAYERRLNEIATDAAVASAISLRDPFAKPQACGDTTGKAAANPDAANSGGAELSVEFASFLKSEASRADKVVEKLNFCIGVLESERR